MISKQQIKHLRLLHQKKYRDEYNLFIAEGFKIINEAILCEPQSLDTIIFTSNSKNHINLQPANQNTKLIEVSTNEFNKISSQTNPQEVLAVIKIPQLKLPATAQIGDISFVLDKLRDPGNFGTIIRLADWFGVKQIFCSPDTVECYNPKVVQSSMGAIFRVEIHYVDLNNYLAEIKQNKSHHIYSTSLNGTDLYKTNLSRPSIIILGNESGGISDNLIELSDENLLIPNYSSSSDKTESLNVSMAAAIICSELRRQTG